MSWDPVYTLRKHSDIRGDNIGLYNKNVFVFHFFFFIHFCTETLLTENQNMLRQMKRIASLYNQIYWPSLENGWDQLIVTLNTQSSYPSVHNQLIRTNFEAHIVVNRLRKNNHNTLYEDYILVVSTELSFSKCLRFFPFWRGTP